MQSINKLFNTTIIIINILHLKLLHYINIINIFKNVSLYYMLYYIISYYMLNNDIFNII